jgi:uncharacterized protein (TIGR02246 family)
MSHTISNETIGQIMEGLCTAWNAGDATAYAAYFTTDCDYITFAGEHIRGRAGNTAAHAALFKGILKGSKLHGQVKDWRLLNDQTILVHGTGTVQLRWQKKAPAKRQSINTYVLVKQQEEWKIAAFHNCRIQKPGWLQKLLMKTFSK